MKIPLAPAAVVGTSVVVLLGAITPAQGAVEKNYALVSATATTANGVSIPSPTNVNATAVNVTTGVRYDLSDLGGGGMLSRYALPDGAYKLRVGGASGWADSWWPNANSEAAASSFLLSKTATDCSPEAIGPAGCYGIVYKPNLQQLRTLTGYVRTRAGVGLAGVTVTAVMTRETASRFTTTTDSTGQYTMSLPPGVYDLSVPNGNRTTSVNNVEVQAPAVSQSLVLLDAPTAPTNVQVAPGPAVRPSAGRLRPTTAAPRSSGTPPPPRPGARAAPPIAPATARSQDW